MPLETEAKMRLPDRAALVETLQRLGGVHVAELAETNTYFDLESGGLAQRDRALRLRIEARDTGTARERRVVILAHKGPRLPGRLKSREETEARVDDAAATTRLLEAMGYRAVLTFEKRRSRYRLDACLIELDELPMLGHFVEIEGPGEDAVLAARAKLGLADEPLVETSYVGLLREYLHTNRLASAAVRFGPPA